MQNDRCTRARGVKPELPQLRVEKPAETLEGMVLFGLGDDGAPAPLTPPRELWVGSLGRNLGFGRRLPLTPLLVRRYAVAAGERDHHGAHGLVQGAAARGAPPPRRHAPATLPAVPADAARRALASSPPFPPAAPRAGRAGGGPRHDELLARPQRAELPVAAAPKLAAARPAAHSPRVRLSSRSGRPHPPSSRTAVHIPTRRLDIMDRVAECRLMCVCRQFNPS